MESKSTKLILLSIAIGIWVIILQNFGVFTKEEALPVSVVNTVGVKGDVSVDGSVDIGNTVDINIEAINGYDDVFFNNYNSNPNKYYRLPIIDK